MSPATGRAPVLQRDNDDEIRSTAGQGGIDAAMIASIKKSLQQRNRQIAQQLEHGSLNDPDYLPFSSGDLGVSDDRAELVFGILERDRNQSISDILRRLLRQNHDALERIASGSYGSCLRCRVPIAPERLKAIPSAQMCVDCQQAEDRLNECRLANAPKLNGRLWG